MAVPCGFLRSAASRAERRVETRPRQATTAAPGASRVWQMGAPASALSSQQLREASPHSLRPSRPPRSAACSLSREGSASQFPVAWVHLPAWRSQASGACPSCPMALGSSSFPVSEHITWRRSQEQGAARRQSRQSTGQCTGARTAGQVDRDVAVAPGKGHGALLGSLSEGRGGGGARAIQGPVLEKCGFCPGIMANLLKAVKCTSDTVRSRVSKGDPSSRGEQAGGDRPVTGQLQKPKEPGRACSLEPSGCGLSFKSSQPWVRPGDATWREGTLVRRLVPSEATGDQESPAECPQDVRCRCWEDLPSPRRTGRQTLVEQTGGVEILERRGC